MNLKLTRVLSESFRSLKEILSWTSLPFTMEVKYFKFKSCNLHPGWLLTLDPERLETSQTKIARQYIIPLSSWDLAPRAPTDEKDLQLNWCLPGRRASGMLTLHRDPRSKPDCSHLSASTSAAAVLLLPTSADPI